MSRKTLHENEERRTRFDKRRTKRIRSRAKRSFTGRKPTTNDDDGRTMYDESTNDEYIRQKVTIHTITLIMQQFRL